MSTVLQDLRHSLRLLFKAPGFTAAAITILALGIGANAAIFSLVNAVLFKPVAYARPAEIVQVFSQDKTKPKTFRGFSYPTYRDIREQQTVFTDVTAYNLAMVGIGERTQTRRAFAATVSSNHFSVLGVRPFRGRAFLPEEETPGRPAFVAIVSYNYWKKRNFDPQLIGSTLVLNGRTYDIVGIMPEGFTGTMHVFSVEVWLPLSVHDIVSNDFSTENHGTLADRAGTQLLILGRLKSGLAASAAAPALATLAGQLEKAFPAEQKDQTFITTPLSRFSTSTQPPEDSELSMLGTLLIGMASVVLLVACLNLANMLLARGASRRKEIAVRIALGGTRGRIVRQLLVEGLVLSLLGGAAGLLLALWGSDFLVSSLSSLMPLDVVWPTGPNPAVLAATFGFCLLGTLVFALGPALKLSRSEVVVDLKANAGEMVTPRRWKYLPRNPLIVAQIALSLALLTAAALFIRGASKAGSVETGLATENSLLLELDASLGGLEPARARELYRAVEERLAALPGVEASSVATTVPFGMVSLSRAVQRAGIHVPADAKPATAADGLAYRAHWNGVGADYFRAVGLKIIRGRALTEAEAIRSSGPASAVIDEALAKKLWPEGDALGQMIQIAQAGALTAGGDGAGAGIYEEGSSDLKPGDAIEIVGIVPTTRRAIFEKNMPGALYVPFARGFQSNVFFHVKFRALSRATEAAAAELVRKAVRDVDPQLPIVSLKTFPQHLEGNLQLWIVRTGAVLFSVFGGVALALAVVGIYGVKAYAVSRRTREIGIRMALGARPESVLWMILREGAIMLGLGVALGFGLAVATGRLVSSMLYQVGALDPISFIVAPLVLAVAALIACWLPARRATRISPLTALRTE